MWRNENVFDWSCFIDMLFSLKIIWWSALVYNYFVLNYLKNAANRETKRETKIHRNNFFSSHGRRWWNKNKTESLTNLNIFISIISQFKKAKSPFYRTELRRHQLRHSCWNSFFLSKKMFWREHSISRSFVDVFFIFANRMHTDMLLY